MASPATTSPDGNPIIKSLRRTGTMLSERVFSWPQARANHPTGEEYKVVVYDPLERKLWIDTKENVIKTEKFVQVPIHGSDTKVKVYMEMGEKNADKAQVFVGSVDLGRLGKWVKGQRKKKLMQHLYVLGQVPNGFGPVEEE